MKTHGCMCDLCSSRVMINYIGSFIGTLYATYAFGPVTLLPALVANAGAVISTQFFSILFMVVPKLFYRAVL